ncbi:MAG: MFS transporter [Clostridium sp.]|uniref:MFS transporter n=1 Tax=Clostridium sp. TaxID=1506 RepID=UPI003D6CBF3D
MQIKDNTSNKKNKKILKFIKTPFNEFLNFDSDVKKYMMMHWCGGFLLIYTTVLPVFMYKMGINIITASTIFSIAAIFDMVLTYVISKFIDKVSPNTCIALDWLTEALPPLIYFIASTGFHFFLGAVTSRVTNVLNSSYQIYENEIYSEDKRSLIYTYHLITPEIFSIIFYPIIGYILTYKYPSINSFRILFLVCGLGYLFVALIPYKCLKWVEPVKIKTNKSLIKFSKSLYMIASAQILINAALGLVSGLLISYYILDKMNGTVMIIILLEVASSLIILITGLVTKNLTSFIAEEKIVQISLIFFILFIMLMIISKNYILIFIAYSFKAIGNTIWFPSHNSLLMKYIPKERRGEVFGNISSANKLIGIISPILSGILALQFGYFVPFSLSIMIFIIVVIIYQRIFRHKIIE